MLLFFSSFSTLSCTDCTWPEGRPSSSRTPSAPPLECSDTTSSRSRLPKVWGSLPLCHRCHESSSHWPDRETHVQLVVLCIATPQPRLLRGSTAGVTPSRVQVAPRRGLPQLRAFIILFTIAHRMHIPATLVEGHHHDTRCCTTLKPGPSQKSPALPQNQKTLPQKRTAPSCPHSSANRPPQTAAQIGRHQPQRK